MPIAPISSSSSTNSLIYQADRNKSLLDKAMERLSTGKRINSGKDDPAGLIGAEQLRTELTDLNATLRTYGAERRSLNLRAAELATVRSGLNDLRGAAVEAAGSLLSKGQRQALQQEVDATVESFDRLSSAPDDTRTIVTGGEGNLVNGDAALAAEAIETAASETALEQAAIAVEQRQLDRYEQITQDQAVIAAESLSRLEDAVYAEEASNATKASILLRSSILALNVSRQSEGEMVGLLIDRISA